MYVCTGCNFSKSTTEKHGTRGGRLLWDALMQQAGERGGAPLHIEPVACLSVCRDACAVALTAPRKYVMTFGWIEPTAQSAAELLELAGRYVDSPTGHVERMERPRGTRRLISRVPPWQFDPDLDDDSRDRRMAAQVPKPARPR